MNVGDKINIEEFNTGHREFLGMQEFVQNIARLRKVWSWGAHAWTKMNDYCLRFKVNGNHFSGHVYLVVNGADLFDVYYTTTRGTIKMIDNDIYLDMLLDTIDKKVEWIEDYIR